MKFLIKYILTKLFAIRYSCFSIGKGCFIMHTKVYNGGRNYVTLGKNVVLRNCVFHFVGNDNHITIKQNAKLDGVTFWLEDDNNHIEIGANTTIESKAQLAACEGTKILIGDDCTFSHDIYVRTTDSHSIIDACGQRINEAKSIIIGHHVWVGMQCLILKGACVPEHCVVGARSMVTDMSILPHSILAGIPARILKTNIDWLRQRI